MPEPTTSRDSSEVAPVSSPPWEDVLPLPNGLACYLTSAKMRLFAKLMVREIFEQKCYWAPGFEFRHADNVVDVGANIGVFALWAAPQVPHGRVVSIEPAPRAYACLELNSRLNQLTNITTIDAAVGRDGAALELTSFPGWEALTRSASLAGPLRAWFRLVGVRSESVRPSVVSLDRVIDEQQLRSIDFLKIDCEGGEYDVLRNTSSASWQRIQRVAMEYHDWRPNHHDELVSILRSNGFRATVKTGFVQSFRKIGMIFARRPS